MKWTWSNNNPREYSKRSNRHQSIQNYNIETVANGNFYYDTTNKREELCSKSSTRELIQQIGANPFLKNDNYTDSIILSNQYLKPINTS